MSTPKKYTLEVTDKELEFLRDIFGMIMPVASDKVGEIQDGHIVEMLGVSTKRAKLEQALWKKIHTACTKAKIVVGDNAPNYAVNIDQVPTMYVYDVSAELLI